MYRQYAIGAAMIAAVFVIILAGTARSQEVGMPTLMTGFLFESEADVDALLDKMEPNIDFDEARERAKGTGCAFSQSAGIVKSVDGTYVNKAGDLFSIIAVTAEDKVLYTWRLLKAGTAA
jgi:hypothetical protein